MGQAKFDERPFYKSSARITDDRRYAYHTVAARSTGVAPLWIDGEALSPERDFGELPVVDNAQYALAIGALSANERGSDFAISDLLVYDRVLSDEEVVKVSNLLQNRVKRAVQCCWDEHMGVKVEQMF